MKSSAILVALRRPFHQLPVEIRDAARIFLFQCVGGLTPAHQERWFRAWRPLLEGRGQPVLHIHSVIQRDERFHRAWMAFETRLYEAQDHFTSKRAMRLWLKTGAAFGAFEASGGRMVFVPSSLAWEECSEDEMREFTQDAMEFLQSPEALATLWPQVDERDRLQMLLLTRNPPREQQETEHAHA